MARIFITGGGRGIGYELARLYLAEGHELIIGARDVAAAQARLPQARIVPLDVADSASVAALPDALGDGSLDILVNNAGIIGPERQSSTDMDFDGFARTLAVNTLGPLRVTQALLPALRKAVAGKVAVISSQMGSLASSQPGFLAYRASKAAVNKVTQCMATDLAPEGIAVAALHPGWVRTDMGGPQADLDPVESAQGLKGVIDGLTLETTGRFWTYAGTEIPW